MLNLSVQFHLTFIERRYLNKNTFLIFLTIFSLILALNDDLIAQYKVKTVVIDAGHGGKDPGALGKKSKEKDLALAIALKLGNYISENIPGVKVVYTRKTDVFVELFKRAEIANKINADVFISVHINANKSSKYYGTSTYAMGLHKSEENLEVAKLENSEKTWRWSKSSCPLGRRCY